MKTTFVFDKLISDFKNTSLALGFFDGVHMGHQKVLNSAVDLSQKLGTKSTVLTFKNHPIEILYNVVPEFITTYKERINLFKKIGFDAVVIPEFTKQLSLLSAQEYLEQVILKFEPKSISVGYNHKFGCKQSGTIEFLEQMSKKYNYILDVVAPVKNKNEVTSSTLIRNTIKQGDVSKAHKLLGKPYSITNTVIHGAKRGRLLNFPTANLEFPEKKIVPEFGVYAGIVTIGGKQYKAISNIGLRPTFGDITIPLQEIHILDFSKDIYNETLTFEFLNKVRDEIKFSSFEKLKEQIKKDILAAKF